MTLLVLKDESSEAIGQEPIVEINKEIKDTCFLK